MRGIHRRHKQRRSYGVTQNPYIGKIAEKHGNDKAQQAEYHRLDAYRLEVFHIHLQACKKHYVIQANIAEKLETAVTVEYVKPMLSDKDSRKNHTYYMRDVQLAENYGRKKYDAQNDEKNPRGISHRQLYMW